MLLYTAATLQSLTFKLLPHLHTNTHACVPHRPPAVEGLRQLLADARVSSSGDGAAAPGEDGQAADGGAAPVPPLHRGVARESAPGEFIELHSSREGGTPAASVQPSGSAGGPAQRAQQAQQQDGVDGAMSPGVASPRAGDGDAEASSRPAEHMLGKAAASKKLPWATLDKGGRDV